MWILPSHTSVYAPDTEVLTSESVESLANVCGQSLTVKSKPSRASYFSRAWRAGNLMRLRSGLISALSLGKSSPESRSSRAVFHASHSAQPESAPPMKIRDTSSPSSSTASAEHDLPLFSWKTSKASCRPSSRETGGATQPALRFCSMCSESWSAWVTAQRRDYSRRQSMRERLTNERGSLSWPTASARDSKGGYQGGRIRNGKLSMDTLDVAVQAYRPGGMMWPTPVVNDDNKSPQAHLAMKKRIGERDGTNSNRTAITSLNVLVKAMHGLWPTPTAQEDGKIGNRANHGQIGLSNHPALRGECSRQKFEKGKHGQPVPLNPSTGGSRPESWATPQSRDYKSPSGKKSRWLNPERSKNLNDQVYTTVSKAVLSPRWVETLMGLPIGWCMPSCKHPWTIEVLNSGFSATVSSPSAPPSPSPNSLAA